MSSLLLIEGELSFKTKSDGAMKLSAKGIQRVMDGKSATSTTRDDMMRWQGLKRSRLAAQEHYNFLDHCNSHPDLTSANESSDEGPQPTPVRNNSSSRGSSTPARGRSRARGAKRPRQSSVDREEAAEEDQPFIGGNKAVETWCENNNAQVRSRLG